MKLDETDKFLEVENLMCREFYDYYRSNRTYVAKGINQQMLFEKAVSGLLRLLCDMMYRAEGGIHIKDFGYLCNVKSIKKKKQKAKSILSPDVYKYEYIPWFFPENNLGGWYLYVDNYCLQGKKLDKYKLYFDLINSRYEMMAFGVGLHKGGRNVKY